MGDKPKLAIKHKQRSADMSQRISVDKLLHESETANDERVSSADNRERSEVKTIARLAFEAKDRQRLDSLAPAPQKARSSLKLGQARFVHTPDSGNTQAVDPISLLAENNARIDATRNETGEVDIDFDSPDRIKGELYRRRRYQDWVTALLGGVVLMLLIGGGLTLAGAMSTISGCFLVGGFVVYSIGISWMCLGVMR